MKQKRILSDHQTPRLTQLACFLFKFISVASVSLQARETFAFSLLVQSTFGGKRSEKHWFLILCQIRSRVDVLFSLHASNLTEKHVDLTVTECSE